MEIYSIIFLSNICLPHGQVWGPSSRRKGTDPMLMSALIRVLIQRLLGTS